MVLKQNMKHIFVKFTEQLYLSYVLFNGQTRKKEIKVNNLESIRHERTFIL